SCLDLPSSSCRRNPDSQPRTPAIKSSNGVQSPRLFLEMSPSASTSKGFFAWFPASCTSRKVQSTWSWRRVFLLVRHNPLPLHRFHGGPPRLLFGEAARRPIDQDPANRKRCGVPWG